MNKLFTCVGILLLFISANLYAQVKIGDNPGTIDANSLLELESTTKGFLPPRVTLTSKSSVAPLTGTVPSGMLVYNSAGSLATGYYYWNGTEWRLVSTADLSTAVKTADATLNKSENFVLASNDITITLPAVTASDNGLEMTVKNVGSHAHLIVVKGDVGSTIDGADSSTLTRFNAQTYVVNGSNWVIKDKKRSTETLMEVNANSSWTTLQEAIDFLDAHMSGPTVIRLGDETYSISSTINIDLPYDLTFQGMSYGTATIVPSGLSGQPMFRCTSPCYFKMLVFDATVGGGSYGTSAGEDAIRFLGSGTYNEVKDCTFDRFYNTILDSTDAELWVFETDISNAKNNGILIHSNQDSVTVKVAETDFIGCVRGINMDKGDKATIQLASGGYYNALGTDSAIVYHPTTFTSFLSISIKGNLWNNTGHYIDGFDFTRTDGRDANAILESNAGTGDKKPNCYINVTNNATVTTLTLVSTWYKGLWTNTSSSTCKWTIGNNRITYQPANRRDAYITISGNVQVSSATAVFNIGLVKNPGATSALATGITRYGETTLRPGVANQPVQFSTVISLADIAPGDFFELWVNSATAGVTVTFQDIQWLTNTQ
jgi:hypothetical protein